MTVLREAIVLPALFLTVSLLGGLRVDSDVRLVPPPLLALVLGLLLLGVLTRARALAPDRLMNASRGPLENLSGLVVLLALFGACAQVFNLVTPDTGLLHALIGVFFLVQLLTTLAGVRERHALLRSLAVLFGAAFLLRFVVLESLYAPEGGALKRVLTALMEGVTLGTLDYQPHAAATGYVAFLTLVLFLVGLALLPPAAPQTGLERGPGTQLPLVRGELLLVIVLALSAGCQGRSDAEAPAPANLGEAKASTGGEKSPGSAESRRLADRRDDALSRARVWRQPGVPVSRAQLGENPMGEGAFRPTDEVSCRFVLESVGGSTPKFNCQLPTGDVIKVKYGESNQELPSEVAASRLLSALGFGADRMFVVRKVRCAGCPPFPFAALRCLAQTGLQAACIPGGLDYDRIVDVQPAVVERRLDGEVIEAVEKQGWAWYELDRIDSARGGSPRAEVDALRLMAVLLAHWDNKAENQRLVCTSGEPADAPCTKPLALIQDLGASFGPTKVDLVNWRRNPMWADRGACRVSMEHLPWAGGTFPERQISEEGRLLLLGLLRQLDASQLEALFTASGVTSFDGLSAEARNPRAWVAAFQDKVRQIEAAGPCPPAATPTNPASR